MTKYWKTVTTNPLVSNYLKIFSVDVLVKGSGIILLPIYLSLMTPEEFGLFGYLVAIIGTFSLVFNLGIYTAQSKFYHEFETPDARAVMLGTLNITLFVFIALLFGVIFITRLDYRLVEFLIKAPIDYDNYRLPVLVGVLSAVYSLMLINYFLTSEDLKRVQYFNIARIVLINVVVLAALYLGVFKDGALTRLTFTNATEIIIIGIFSIAYFRKMRFTFDRKIALKAIGVGLPILASAVLGIFINLSDRFFLEKYGTLKDLSLYNVSLSVAGVIPFLFASFQNIWLPQFLKEKNIQSNRARSRRMVARLAGMMVIASIGILIAMKILLELDIIDERYDNVMPLLPIVLVTSIVTALTTMFSNHLIYLNKLFVIVLTGIPIAVLGILINIWLVPLFNVYGAALSSLILNACFLVTYASVSTYYYNRHPAS